jgi:hypothetical protein
MNGTIAKVYTHLGTVKGYGEVIGLSEDGLILLEKRQAQNLPLSAVSIFRDERDVRFIHEDEKPRPKPVYKFDLPKKPKRVRVIEKLIRLHTQQLLRNQSKMDAIAIDKKTDIINNLKARL